MTTDAAYDKVNAIFAPDVAEKLTDLLPNYAHLMAMEMNQYTFDYDAAEEVLMKHLEQFVWDVLLIEHTGYRDNGREQLMDIEIAELEKEIAELCGERAHD